MVLSNIQNKILKMRIVRRKMFNFNTYTLYLFDYDGKQLFSVDVPIHCVNGIIGDFNLLNSESQTSCIDIYCNGEMENPCHYDL